MTEAENEKAADAETNGAKEPRDKNYREEEYRKLKRKDYTVIEKDYVKFLLFVSAIPKPRDIISPI